MGVVILPLKLTNNKLEYRLAAYSACGSVCITDIVYSPGFSNG